MLKVANNQIYLTRGDTMIVELALANADGTAYEPAAGDTVIFRLKKNAAYKEMMLEKGIDIPSLTLQLDPEDTAALPFGDYRYEIEVVTEAGMHCTVIEDELFTLGRELENHG